MTVAEATRLTQLRIRPAAQEEDLAQACALVGCVLGIERAALMLHHDMELTREQLAELGALAERRASGEPLQYILGVWYFMGLPFFVRPGALIPRQDTEVLCEHALALARALGYQSALDLCCGSGCIGVSLAALGALGVTSADISADCAALTQENARENGVSIDVRTGDLFDCTPETFDLIVCNPPYLSGEEMRALQREVTFEPRLALDGGADGLAFYRRIAAQYRAHLNPGGALLLEIGCTQAEEVCALFEGAQVKHDYAGKARVVTVRRA